MAKKKDFSELFDESASGQKETSFEELLNQSLKPQTLRAGDTFTGEILAITGDEIFVKTGSPVDGVLARKDLKDAEHLKVGDGISVQVVRVREDQIFLRPVDNRSAVISGDLSDAHDMELPVEGKVGEVVKGGVRVSVQGQMAFCPISQLDSRFVEKPEDYVGKTFEFIITEYDPKNRKFVVSRRKYLDLTKAEKEGEFLQTKEEGDLVSGRIVRLENYGAFVDLGQQVSALIPISELSWKRIGHPKEVVNPGDQVMVKIIRIVEEVDRLKISASLKQADGSDPWAMISQKYPLNTNHPGVIERRENYGLFINLEPGISGLLPKSQWKDSPEHSGFEKKKVGEKVTVRIFALDLASRKLTLGLQTDQDDTEWMQYQNKEKKSMGTLGDLLKNSIKK